VPVDVLSNYVEATAVPIGGMTAPAALERIPHGA